MHWKLKLWFLAFSSAVLIARGCRSTENILWVRSDSSRGGTVCDLNLCKDWLVFPRNVGHTWYGASFFHLNPIHKFFAAAWSWQQLRNLWRKKVVELETWSFAVFWGIFELFHRDWEGQGISPETSSASDKLKCVRWSFYHHFISV